MGTSGLLTNFEPLITPLVRKKEGKDLPESLVTKVKACAETKLGGSVMHMGVGAPGWAENTDSGPGPVGLQAFRGTMAFSSGLCPGFIAYLTIPSVSSAVCSN